MNDTKRAITLVAELLERSQTYPWKTAKYLCEKLRQDYNCQVDQTKLEQALIKHAQTPARQIRYSFFPARKTLDLLWGHVRQVNDFDVLPDPHLDPDQSFIDAVGVFGPCNIPNNAPWCFLSHNFRDLDVVRNIRTELISRGYGVWIAEAEIFHGEMITHKVQEGLERADRFIVYMSRRSLGSRWVLKEAGVDINRWHLPPTIILDGTDPKLCELFAPWLKADWDPAWLSEHLDRLLIDANEEPAATMLPDLLIGAFKDINPEKRRAMIFPANKEIHSEGFATIDDLFPNINP